MIQDNIKATGEFRMSVYKNGELIAKAYEHNLYLTLGKTNIAKLLGGDAAGKAITQIAVGESNIGAQVGDNALTNSFSKSLSNVTYPDAQSVMFHFDIDNAEANGLAIVEFGLLNADGVLCARKVRDAVINKSNSIRLVGSWTITIN